MSEIHTSRVGGDPERNFKQTVFSIAITVVIQSHFCNVIFANTPNRFCDRKPFFIQIQISAPTRRCVFLHITLFANIHACCTHAVSNMHSIFDVGSVGGVGGESY